MSVSSRLAGIGLRCVKIKNSAKQNTDGIYSSRSLLTDGKRHIYICSINMADELIQQAQELFEGQIVGGYSISQLAGS